MHLRRAQRKIILLYAALEEQLSKGRVRLIKDRYSVPSPHGWLPKLARGDLSDWRATQTPQTGTLEDLDAFTIEVFPEIAKKSETPVSDDRLGVHSFGEALGIKKQRTKRIIDIYYDSILPAYDAVFQPKFYALELTKSLAGLYNVYRIDRNSRTVALDNVPEKHSQQDPGYLIRAALCIRSAIPSHFRAHEMIKEKRMLMRIRCKLVNPLYDRTAKSDVDIIKYDGHVGPARRVAGKPHHLQFLLNSRIRIDNPQRMDASAEWPVASQDIMLMYSEYPHDLGDGYFGSRGVLMTQNQGDHLLPTVSSVLLVKKLDILFKEDFGEPCDRPDAYSQYPGFVDTDGEVYYEREFMRPTPDMFSLRALNDLDKQEQWAVFKLKDGWDIVNRRGLW